jgi:asparagine synthase (glutamine-hydrolysing)
MCGITGIAGPAPIGRETLEGMMAALTHRGPDDAGTYFAPGIALGHRRLSIIDLAGGRQPIANEDESVWVILNGEIYNYRALRKELQARGHRFATHTDTEVIVHLYEEFGDDCVRHLRGMFAFAVWDDRRKRLLVARDHLGQKPLFYAEADGQFYFGSEIKAILAALPDRRRVEPAALDQYLSLRIVASPHTMFAGVTKLPPGHLLSYQAETGIELRRYWDLCYEPKLAGTEDALLAELEERLIECFRLHTVADVPIGAFMSGGLDSTLVVSMMKAHGLAPDLQTFSVSLPYGKFDEAPAARLVARKYGTIHHEQTLSPSLIETLPELVWHLDEPSDPLSVCQYLISAFARRHVKVVLGGEGGDELFGGYDRYYGNLYAGYYARVPAAIRRHLVGPLLRLLPQGRWYKSVAHQLNWIHRMSFHEGGDRYASSLEYFYFEAAQRRHLYGPVMQAQFSSFDAAADIRRPYDNANATRALDRMLYADTQVRLPDHPVMILDRMSMAHGLEARAPFMDHEIAEFAARLPVELKVRGRTTRYIQRRLAEKYLPPELLSRPKQGFQSALPYMLRDEYRQLFALFLSSSRLARNGFLDQQAVGELLQRHLAGKVDHANRLWLLLNAEVWYRMHIEGESRGDIRQQIAASCASKIAPHSDTGHTADPAMPLRPAH